MQSLGQSFNALVIGATGGIGGAFLEQLEAHGNCQYVARLDRANFEGFDLRTESSIIETSNHFQNEGALFDLIIDATGALEIDGKRPERAFAEIDPANMAAHFAINAIGTALIIKHFAPLMRPGERSVFATLGARVGSIEDNKLGGWVSYRAAKAAKNQIVRTASIEIQRKQKQHICVALHPGTVATRLSENYNTPSEKFTPLIAAKKLLSVIDGLVPNDSGYQFAYDGSRVQS
ncbi:SDR family NAD(P)-dependent oxidoreductase [Maritalea porphyrae]|jgi:NAD(P)-dependent dehydrogenase (short-subunit alcohol dehydrogenase family)|uniref:SDR family NAD(P)-dependent oxidoreductase n=1 Tax=Maritalea porphyrae TaxID=880732 RepID=UPI0022AE637B|nr:SDR family NAD(P)-dependent oxidoreductase [Maritalea porphyrae]MCZ4273173.1 SDR family NAD(P)-dependent oxidoreductase [Maritalea porphyrae]